MLQSAIAHPSFRWGQAGSVPNIQLFKFDKMFNRNIVAAMSRLSIEIDKEQHRQIKTLATFAGMSIVSPAA